MDALEELQPSDELYEARRPPWRALIIVAAVIVLLVLAIFLPPLINLGKYKRSLTASMSEALGRPVYVGGIQLRLLPMPGIVMSDFTVDEDPAFGYEPALHASSVVASLRFSSLWRGRLEVSRISLDEASLNLVRNSVGQWSVDSMLLRASQISNAPTGERRVGPRPRFPYIEATDSRINFKNGAEKKPFSLMNAEFSMWQANADEWRVRLRAQPVRTDLQLHLYDTGELNVEGSLRRALDLNAMPVDLRAEWSGAQLGQVTRLIAGMDSGWRGDLDATVGIRGTVGDLQLQSRVQVGNLRRQEFQPATNLDVDANCRSEYHRVERRLDNITCFWPVGSGHLLLTGSVEDVAARNADLQLEINQVPASFPTAILGLARPRAQNVTATGTMNGNFHLTSGPGGMLTGDATAAGVSLRYPGGALTLPAMHFVAEGPQPEPRGKPALHASPHAGRKPQVATEPTQRALVLEAMPIAMGLPEPLVADARFTRAGFELNLAGQATLAKLLPAAANFGLLENASTLVAPKGRATLKTTTAGNWMRPLAESGSGIGTNGTLKIEGAELRPAFLPAPVAVESAEITLTPEEISWQNVTLVYKAMPLRGSIQFPAMCNQGVACPASFTLAADALDAATVEVALGGKSSGFLGQFFTNALGGGNGAKWPMLRGELQCATLRLGKLPLRGVTAALSVEGNKLTLSSVDATALGGPVRASGEMAIEDGAPHWTLSIRVAGANAADLGPVFGEPWGSGTLNGETHLTLNGYRAQDLASSAKGDFSFTWQNGSLPAPERAVDFPLEHFERWTAKGTIANGGLALTGGGIASAARTNAVRGSIGFDRTLDLTLETRRGHVKIGGTLAQPVVQ
ncbi:MAG: AsmA family protein [Acidobacteriaceae bacterium]